MDDYQKEKQKATTIATKISKLSFVFLTSAVLALLAIAAVVAGIGGAGTLQETYAQENDRRAISETITIDEPVDTTFCENGEVIQLSGDMHLVGRLVQDETGTHAVFHVNAQGIRGEGLTTGSDYRFVYAVNTISFRFGNDVPETATSTLSGHIISEGSSESAPNLLVRALFHATVNANGQITVFLDSFNPECR